jgi:predicted nuclease with TOPRIM domain
MSREPRVALPGYTCSEIDSVIELMEDLRKANEALREWCAYYEERVAEVETERDNLEENLEGKLDALEDKIEALTEELEALKS